MNVHLVRKLTEKYKRGGLDTLGAHVEDLLRATADVTAAEPGGVWIERAMRAVPVSMT